MVLLAAYAFAFVSCTLLALQESGHLQAASRSSVEPLPAFMRGCAALAAIAVLVCALAYRAFDVWMSIIATLCIVMLAAINVTLILGILPQMLIRMASSALVLGLLFVAVSSLR